MPSGSFSFHTFLLPNLSLDSQLPLAVSSVIVTAGIKTYSRQDCRISSGAEVLFDNMDDDDDDDEKINWYFAFSNALSNQDYYILIS